MLVVIVTFFLFCIDLNVQTKIQVVFQQYLARNPSPARRSFKVTKRSGTVVSSYAADTYATSRGIRPRGKVTVTTYTPAGLRSPRSTSSSQRRAGTAPAHATRPPTYSDKRTWDGFDEDLEDQEEGHRQAERELQLERQKASARLRAQQMQAMD